ncbi:16S rRNA (cytosine(1402)-N(4))-methyltransferase RsmH [Paramicrobacterium sp. CJ85]|uniref:16S rRNA (cytosine(1402)-N(4))-methyltransferase RsmH n=1 Tax=Paramicrobacterium sp. CJ85 TaxID=3445355 RepID=UPI003F630656
MAIDDIHTPVLLDRCIELLEPAVSGGEKVLIDATLGMGGHTEALLERFPQLHVIGLDRDSEALGIARDRLSSFESRLTTVKTEYDAIAMAKQHAGVGRIDGILFDLGVSSLQLDRVERGFSYSHDAPLDMRMDDEGELTAEKVLAEYSEADLRRIFHRYGEEKLAGRYARAIVKVRETAPLTRSAELVRIIDEATPAAARRSGHPAKRVFQALRIEVNSELAVLERAVPAALDAIAQNGRVVVMSYQSLEDRIVKQAFQAATSSSAPIDLPVELPEHQPEFRLLTRGAERASESEIAANPRATPVRLRAVERIRGNTP